MISWIVRNKKWLFSGVGVGVVASTIAWLQNEPELPSPNSIDLSKVHADGSSVIVNVPGSASGITVYQVPPIGSTTQRSNLPVGISESRTDTLQIEVTLEATQTGLKKVFFFSPDAKFFALYSIAVRQFELLEKVEVGPASPLNISWALVDVLLEKEYNSLPPWKRYFTRLMLRDSAGTVRKKNSYMARLWQILVFPNILLSTFIRYQICGIIH